MAGERERVETSTASAASRRDLSLRVADRAGGRRRVDRHRSDRADRRQPARHVRVLLASWHYVERRALSLKKSLSRRTTEPRAPGRVEPRGLDVERRREPVAATTTPRCRG
jgi:hypothetical protein